MKELRKLGLGIIQNSYDLAFTNPVDNRSTAECCRVLPGAAVPRVGNGNNARLDSDFIYEYFKNSNDEMMK